MEGQSEFRNQAIRALSEVGMIARDTTMEPVIEGIMAAAIAPVDVLIQGATGTGKELVVQAITTLAKQRAGKLISVNCSLFEGSDLIESTLFGHKKGAFTGASADQPGVFEEANRGFLFLDEIHNMPILQQNKLLRVLQERRGSRVGSHQEVEYDFRLISATNRDLEEEVRCGQFKDDLYHRINCITIDLPPLCVRKEDILPIAKSLLRLETERFVTESGGQIIPAIILEKINSERDSVFTDDLVTSFQSYDWPGNVRELHNEIRSCLVRLAIRADTDFLDALDPSFFSKKLQLTPKNTYEPTPLDVEHIRLPDSLQSSIEILAEHNHDLWAKARISEGWSFGPVRDEIQRTTPCLVKYDHLPEHEKEVDRSGVIGIFKALYKLDIIGSIGSDYSSLFDTTGISLKQAVKLFEAKAIEKALMMTANNQTRASSLLGMSRERLNQIVNDKNVDEYDRTLAKYRAKR